jgi:hypothetical protein
VSVALMMSLAGTALGIVNDTRATATILTLPVTGVSGTTVGAAYEAGTPGSCGISNSSPDVWYRLTAPASGSVEFTTCTASYDSVVEIFVDNAGALGPSVGCDDDTCGNTHSKVRVNLTAGVSYFVRVSGYNGATGTFELTAMPPAAPEIMTPSLGPDVTIGDLSDVGSYGTTTIGGVAYGGFAVGTNSWNIGDRNATWVSGTAQHPVIGQQMYRLKGGRFEQIGVSWVKHGFFATNSQDFQDGMAYPTSDNRVCVPAGTGAALGVNCSDLYSSSLNGGRSYLGPRYDINPATGGFTYPWTPLVNSYTPTDSSDKVSRRIMVRNTDLADGTARYFVDAVYVTPDDAKWGNARNNFTAREISTPPTGAGAVTFVTGNARRKTALEYWPTIDPTVTLVPVDFVEWVSSVNDTLANPPVTRQIPVNGRFQVASKVTDLGNGTWSYEYAVMNLNVHRGASAFVVGTRGASGVTSIGQSAPMYHSGDRIDNSAWTTTQGAGYVAWNVQTTFPGTVTMPGAPAGSATLSGVEAKYIRWGALHNYRFVSSKPPVTGYARMKLGRAPAGPTGFQGDTLVVNGLAVPAGCLADIAGANQSAGGDGALTADDIIVFLGAYFGGDLWASDVAGPNQSTSPDAALTADDIIVFLNGYFSGC